MLMRVGDEQIVAEHAANYKIITCCETSKYLHLIGIEPPVDRTEAIAHVEVTFNSWTIPQTAY